LAYAEQRGDINARRQAVAHQELPPDFIATAPTIRGIQRTETPPKVDILIAFIPKSSENKFPQPVSLCRSSRVITIGPFPISKIKLSKEQFDEVLRARTITVQVPQKCKAGTKPYAVKDVKSAPRLTANTIHHLPGVIKDLQNTGIDLPIPNYRERSSHRRTWKRLLARRNPWSYPDYIAS
jgi:hypothetical protein